MTVLDYENTIDVTTRLRDAAPETRVTQSNPVTRLTFDAVSSEIETRAIEGNREFYATIMERLGAAPVNLIDADRVL